MAACDRQPRARSRIKPPLEHVLLNDKRACDAALDRSLRLLTDIDEDRSPLFTASDASSGERRRTRARAARSIWSMPVVAPVRSAAFEEAMKGSDEFHESLQQCLRNRS